MKDEKLTPTSHRQGSLVDLLDKIRFIIDFGSSIPVEISNDNSATFNQAYIEKMTEKLKELREFDITAIGDLYLTTGGRVVLDRGYGEYFTEKDIKLFTLSALKQGIPKDVFLKILKEKVYKDR